MGKPKVDDRNGSHELDPFTRPMHTVTSKIGSATITFYPDEDDMTRTAAKVMGQGMIERHGDRPERPIDSPAFTVRAQGGGSNPAGLVWHDTEDDMDFVSNQGDGERYSRPDDHPAPTISSGTRSARWSRPNGDLDEIEDDMDKTTIRFAGAGATAQYTARQRPRNDNEPAHTVTAKRTATWLVEGAENGYEYLGDDGSKSLVTMLRRDEGRGVALVLVESGSLPAGAKITIPLRKLTARTARVLNLDPAKPATTVAADPRLSSRSHHFHGEQNSTSTLVTVAEAALLQTYPTHLTKGPLMDITALDLFAGHGWGVACQWLGIDEKGVEINENAVKTRTANDMTTIYRDVWDGLEGAQEVPEHDLEIASPPCQTFSMAGGGAGRRALDEVVGLIDAKAYRDVAALRAFGERHDPRTSLVLTPLAYAYQHLPRFIVLEQVPPVLPVWERVAVELESWGYSTWTGVLNAEQYGVPQTRRRAILIAKRDPDIDGPATPPKITHSRYYSRTPDKLDPGVLPWVSMAEALGWGMTERLALTVMVGNESGGGNDPMALGGSGSRKTMREAYEGERWAGHAPSFVSNDRQANSAKRGATEPAPTITAGHDSGNRVWVSTQSTDGTDRRTRRDQSQPATTILANSGRVKIESDSTTAAPVTLDDVAQLQTYPREFVWPGTKTASFLEIGNAVPPLLARVVLEAVLGL